MAIAPRLDVVDHRRPPAAERLEVAAVKARRVDRRDGRARVTEGGGEQDRRRVVEDRRRRHMTESRPRERRAQLRVDVLPLNARHLDLLRPDDEARVRELLLPCAEGERVAERQRLVRPGAALYERLAHELREEVKERLRRLGTRHVVGARHAERTARCAEHPAAARRDLDERRARIRAAEIERHGAAALPARRQIDVAGLHVERGRPGRAQPERHLLLKARHASLQVRLRHGKLCDRLFDPWFQVPHDILLASAAGKSFPPHEFFM